MSNIQRREAPRASQLTFKVAGSTLRSSLLLGARALEIEMNVPLAFRLLKRRALRAIDEEVKPWLAAAARGDLP